MDKGRWFVIIFLLYFLGFFAHALYLKRTVYGDGVYYYTWLRSFVVDHDIDFRDEYEFFHVQSPQTPTGLVANKFAIGPALLWLPWYSLARFVFGGTGFELPYQLIVGTSSVLYTLAGLVLLYGLLTEFFPAPVSALTVLAIALATNLYFYGSLDAVNSHAPSFFAACLFLRLILAKRKNWLAIGLILALLGIIRTQDLLFGILLVPLFVKRGLYRFLLGLFLGLLPQFISWQALYGKFWVSPYLTHGEYFSLLSPHVLPVLFSMENGLFLYSPILLLGLVGLFFWKNQLRVWAYSVIILEVFVVSTWSTWWQGASYGGRMFVSSLPLFAFGIAHVFQWLSRRGWNQKLFFLILVGPLSALNMLLIFFFLLFH